jgi:hypothetical protein
MTILTLEQINENQREIRHLLEDLVATNAATAAAITQIRANLDDLNDTVEELNDCPSRRFAMNGSALIILDSAAEDVSAAALNAAAAGTFQRTFTARLETAGGGLHEWAAFDPSVTTTKGTVADGDVAAPTVVGTPLFLGGRLTVTITFDTDAGATKTYVNGENLTAVVAIQAGDTLLGWSVPAVTKTFNVIA